jgi:hypothetical protein
LRLTARAQAPPKRIVTQGIPLPAPVGGWDGISPLANMPVDRAYQLDNWVARPGWIEPRKGSIVQCTGVGGPTTPVQTLMPYNGFASNNLFAVAGGTIYDCTVQGPAVATSVTGLGSSRMQYVMFSNAADLQYLIAVNGTDSPWLFDGSDWTQPVITGYGGPSLALLQAYTVSTGNVLSFGATTSALLNTSADVETGNVIPFLSASGILGYYVIGENIPADATVTAINSSIQLTTAQDTPSGDILPFVAASNIIGFYATAANIPANTTVTQINTVVPLYTNQTTSTGTTLYFNSTAGLSNGQYVIGTNINTGTTISSFTGTTVTLSQAVLGSVPSGEQINFANNSGGFTGVVLSAGLTGDVPNGTAVTFSPIPQTQLTAVTVTVTPSGNVLTFANTTGIEVGYYAIAPGIPSGTSVTAVGASTVTLSVPITSSIPAATTITFSTTPGSFTGVTISADILGFIANGSILTFSPTPGTTGIEVGNYVVAAGIPTGTTVTNVSPTTVTISNNIEIGSSIDAGATVQFDPTATQAGFNPANFVQVNQYAQRLWFVIANSTNIVYMNNIGGVSGEASVFPLGQLMRYGGYIQAIGTWTVDTRQSVDEYMAIITSRGEVIVYQGTDPSTATTWNLVGIYKIGAPIGRRCFLRISGDLQIITVDGLVGMSEMLSTDRAAANRVSLTSIIMNPIAMAAQAYKNNWGWEVQEYALGTLVILNIPIQENYNQMQYVMNTITGAWSRFIGIDPTGAINAAYGINANTWAVDATDNIYYGGNNGTVYLWNVGGGDNETLPITCVVKGAYNSFGNASQIKNYQMLQALITTTGNPIPAIGVNVDFNDSPDYSISQPVVGVQALWGQVNWGQFNWGAAPTTTNNWLSVQGVGHYVSIVTLVTIYPDTNNPTYSPVTQLNGWNILAQSGAFV